jgi:hypothetical protein
MCRNLKGFIVESDESDVDDNGNEDDDEENDTELVGASRKRKRHQHMAGIGSGNTPTKKKVKQATQTSAAAAAAAAGKEVADALAATERALRETVLCPGAGAGKASRGQKHQQKKANKQTSRKEGGEK